MNQSPYRGEPNDGNDLPHGGGNSADASAEDNAYLNHVAAQAMPDLDATAPRLRSAEEQRLNRKALAFLGAILVLIVAMGMLVLRKQGDDDKARQTAESTRAAAPELPQLAGEPEPASMPSVPPVPMLPSTPRETRDLSEFVLPPPAPVREVERRPSIVDRRIGNGFGPGEGEGAASASADYTQVMMAALQAGAGGQPPSAPAAPRRGPDVEDVSSAANIRSPDALLVRGTYLRCILETRIVTDFAGYTSCLLTEPVYSINGRTQLLPKGSKIYGSYGGDLKGARVEVIWDRITTPNGIDIAMSSPGIDGLGSAGMPGHYTAHWGKRIASALMISLISDAFKYAAAEHGPQTTTVTGGGLAVQTPYQSATARSMERLASEALSNRRDPTVTINQGSRVNIYVAKDVDFSQVIRP